MEMIAVIPLRIMVPFRVVSGEALNKIIVGPEMAIMMAMPMLT
jgi:hypothetical protein